MIEADFTPREWMLHGADPDAVFAVGGDCVTFIREAELLKVRTVLRVAELFPASGEDAACWGDLDGSDCDVPINREGCPGVLLSAVAELAGRLQMKTAGAMYLFEACLELRFRLPKLYARLEALEIDFSRARHVTSLTAKLGPEAAAFVDARLAPIIHKVGRVRVAETVAIAIAMFHPELVEEKARQGKARWDVRVEHPDLVDFASTSELDASADSLDLEDFMAAVAMIAEDLARDGDSDSAGQRRAKSLGIIGRAMTGRAEHPSPDQRPAPVEEPVDGPPEEPAEEAAEDPAAEPADEPIADPQPEAPENTTSEQTPAQPTLDALLDRLPVPQSPRRRRRHGITVHAHFHVDPMTGDSDPIYWLRGLGAVTEEVFQRWLATHGVKVTRVIDLNRKHAVDRHDPPPWMRDQVRERDRHCVFPGCEVPAEQCDCDHIIPYDENGPPGQTNPDALGCLCRMHHLLKTHYGWRYGRLSDGAYLWVSPTGHCYRVDQSGTTWELTVAA